MSLMIPIPRCAITVRPGTMDDVPFLDSLQKMHTKQVGWMPTKQLEGKIRAGHVLIAEEMGTTDGADLGSVSRLFKPCGHGLGTRDTSVHSSAKSVVATPVGYCIGHDQYFKRDDVGIIYQLNVLPTKRRSLVGATLVKAMFERAAYGCKLFCCWCAQDIEANWFWESIGFVPLAFRAGSRGTGRRPQARVHIFWQRRIRAGDTTTPYWFPSQTTSGSIREDRLVFPIPPGVHWRDAMPILLPRLPGAENEPQTAPKRLPGTRRKPTLDVPSMKPTAITWGGLRFATPGEAALEAPTAKRKRRTNVKNDPKLVAAARELRDRWLERVNADPSVMLSQGKYDVSRALPRTRSRAPGPRAVPAALAAPIAA